MAVVANAWYSALGDDREIVFAFFVFEEIREPLRKIKNPMINFWVSRYAAQSRLEKARSCRGDEQ